MNVKKLMSVALLSGLVACGGGGEYEYRMLSTFDATQSEQVGFTSTTSPPAYDAKESVESQLRGVGDIALQIPAVKDGNFRKVLPHLHEALKHRDRIKWIYVFDEMFYSPRGGVRIGEWEHEITEAALTVQWYGMKSAVSMLPEVILDRNFRLANMKAFDVIAVDVYPSNIGPGREQELGCDPVTDNPGSNLLYCSFM